MLFKCKYHRSNPTRLVDNTPNKLPSTCDFNLISLSIQLWLCTVFLEGLPHELITSFHKFYNYEFFSRSTVGNWSVGFVTFSFKKLVESFKLEVVMPLYFSSFPYSNSWTSLAINKLMWKRNNKSSCHILLTIYLFDQIWIKNQF